MQFMTGMFIGVLISTFIYVLASAGNRIWFKVRCPCCGKEIVVDPVEHASHRPNFEEEE